VQFLRGNAYRTIAFVGFEPPIKFGFLLGRKRDSIALIGVEAFPKLLDKSQALLGAQMAYIDRSFRHESSMTRGETRGQCDERFKLRRSLEYFYLVSDPVGLAGHNEKRSNLLRSLVRGSHVSGSGGQGREPASAVGKP
jgi:hypothetical protein